MVNQQGGWYGREAFRSWAALQSWWRLQQAGKFGLECQWMLSQVLLVKALQRRPVLEKGPAASSCHSTSSIAVLFTQCSSMDPLVFSLPLLR